MKLHNCKLRGIFLPTGEYNLSVSGDFSKEYNLSDEENKHLTFFAEDEFKELMFAAMFQIQTDINIGISYKDSKNLGRKVGKTKETIENNDQQQLMNTLESVNKGYEKTIEILNKEIEQLKTIIEVKDEEIKNA